MKGLLKQLEELKLKRTIDSFADKKLGSEYRLFAEGFNQAIDVIKTIIVKEYK